MYPSAGGLYPIQTYLYIKDNTIEKLLEGLYYYHPIKHTLMLLAHNVLIPADIHDPFINKPIFEKSSLSIYLIANKNSIVPVYGDQSRNFCFLEAGYMSQLLMMRAPSLSIGLCPIGSLNFESIRSLLNLSDNHVLIHSLIGGALDYTECSSDSLIEDGNSNEIVEGII